MMKLKAGNEATEPDIEEFQFPVKPERAFVFRQIYWLTNGLVGMLDEPKV